MFVLLPEPEERLTPHGARAALGSDGSLEDSLPWLCLLSISEKKLPILPGSLQSSESLQELGLVDKVQEAR